MDTKIPTPSITNAVRALGVALICIYAFFQVQNGGDFTIFLSGADAIYHHINCYHTAFKYQGIQMFNSYSYSPTFALLLSPFSQLPMKFTQFVFLLSYPLMIWRIFKLVELQLPLATFSTNEKRVFLLLTGLSVIRFILHNAEEGQVNILLLYMTMEALYQIFHKNRMLAGGFLIALGCIIKILPVVFIPYLIYRKKFVAALCASTVLLLLVALPVPFLGLPFTKELLADWWGVINPLRPEYTYQANSYASESIQNIAAFVGVFFSETSLNGVSVTLAQLSPGTVNSIILLSQGVFVLLTIFFLQSYPFTSAKNSSAAFYEQAYIFLITPLIFPHQQKYAFVYILPAYAFIYSYLILQLKKDGRIWCLFYFLLVLAFCLLTLTTDGLIGMRLSHITQYLKTITFGCFILIMLLGMCNRNLSASQS